jgi:hypothetical protein
MPITHPRANVYIWVTWITSLLAGSDACTWAAWFKAHHVYRKVGSFDESAWQAEHDMLVASARDGLIADEFEVTEEDRNGFAIANAGITLAGRPDLIAVKTDRVLIVDAKSGFPRPSHRFQVLTYMAVLPYIRPDLRARTIDGLIVYQDVEVHVPSSAIDAEFRAALRAVIHQVGGPIPPARVPSVRECVFCPIGAGDCPDRVESARVLPVVSDQLF